MTVVTGKDAPAAPVIQIDKQTDANGNIKQKQPDGNDKLIVEVVVLLMYLQYASKLTH